MLLEAGICFSLIWVSTEGLPQTVPSTQQDSTALKGINAVEYRVGGEDGTGVSVLTKPVTCEKEQETIMHNMGRTETVLYSADMPWGSSTYPFHQGVSDLWSPPTSFT